MERKKKNKNRKKFSAILFAVLLAVCCLGGCGKEGAGDTATSGNVSGAASGDVSKDAEGSQPAILVVSFGTSYNDSRDITIGAIEEAIGKAFPDCEVRRAFTSQIIIDKLKERDGLEIDNVEESLERAAKDGVRELIVQPTHLMKGYEYTDLKEALQEYADRFEKIVLAEPLLSSDEDYEAVIQAIVDRTSEYDDGETAICFMGHGTEADSNAVYAAMQEKITADGHENYYVGTVEAEPSIDDVLKALKEKGTYKRVILEPLMVVAGDHANNDMAGDETDSWKSVMEKAGFEVECVIEGLGQIPAIQDIYVEHTRSAVDSGEALTAGDASGASADGDLAGGTYSVEVESSSSMFKVVKAELTVKDGAMTAELTLSGTGYGKLFMGTAEEAESAADSETIPYKEDADGAYTYTVPVRALDEPIDCAAYSIRKEIWYDRQLTFKSDSVSSAEDSSNEETSTEDASVGSSDEGEKENGSSGKSGKPVDASKLKNGNYTIEVTLEGGSGKSTVQSPASLQIKKGKMTAQIVWDSPNYDYMKVNDKKYLPVNNGDKVSIFEIPVKALDEKLDVIGDTVAMSKPHEVEYTLTFHSSTIKKAK